MTKQFTNKSKYENSNEIKKQTGDHHIPRDIIIHLTIVWTVRDNDTTDSRELYAGDHNAQWKTIIPWTVCRCCGRVGDNDELKLFGYFFSTPLNSSSGPVQRLTMSDNIGQK